GQMLVAAMMLAQQGIADLVQRRAVLAGRQRATGGAGKILKPHEMSFRATTSRVPPAARTAPPRRPPASPITCKCLKNYTDSREIQMGRGSRRQRKGIKGTIGRWRLGQLSLTTEEIMNPACGAPFAKPGCRTD